MIQNLHLYNSLSGMTDLNTSSSSSSSSSSSFEYDVFLSFRGDTRYGFSDSLYNALMNERVKTYRDNPDLRVGDVIRPGLLGAIERSRMSIAVLSQNYASSTWCLDELKKIMECSDNGTKRSVFPIFYKVKMSDVRHQKNQYEVDMAEHEKTFGKDSNQVKEWRSALTAVCTLNGEHCTEDMYQSVSIDKIVKRVLEELPPNLLHTRHWTGFDSQLVEVMSLLNIESPDTRCMLGIYGDEEVDKTTFAAELFNKVRHQFKDAHLLADVSKKSKGSADGMEKLQETVLHGMGDRAESKIGSIHEGSSKIKHLLGSKRVLLVLDDVDSIHQLNSLAGGGDWFGSGSRIIITTRNAYLLDNYVLNDFEVKKYCLIKEGLEGMEVDESNLSKRRHVEEDVVGFVNNFNVVIEMLKEKDSGNNVVSIIGMGGLGKTTLAKKIYNNDDVKKLFPCRAWSPVSKDYNKEEVLSNLLKCLSSDSTTEENLENKLRKCLQNKKYLIVLDDIWESKVWDDVRGAFPNDNNGSKILITSRDHAIANCTSSKLSHTLPFLDEEESWKLFCMKVFWREECPCDLEPIGRSIVRSCKGLPLAIVTIAGLVSKKKRLQREWLRIKDHFHWLLTQVKTDFMDVLKFSYDFLPKNLKSCYLYFAIYPEDYKIHARELIQLWITEEFIKPQEDGIPNAPEPEAVGDDYLDELVDRNLVQVISRRSDGGVKTCQIHDLLRDLCISESKTEKFLEVCTKPNFHTLNNPHRLSVLCNIEADHISSINCNQSCTRSLFLFGDTVYSDDILKYFQSVNVLIAGRFGTKLSVLKIMINIKYLKLDARCVQKDLDCIQELRNLEILYIGPPGSIYVISPDSIYVISERHIPNTIWKLKRLRHIKLWFEWKLQAEHNQGANNKIIMWNLQTLCSVHVDQQLGFLLNNGSFPNLEKLGLWCNFGPLPPNEYSMAELLRSLRCLTNLRTLQIRSDLTLSELSLDNASAFPSNLTKLTLSGCFDFKAMDILGRIANLQILKLVLIFQTPIRLHCGALGDFPQLLVFQMREMLDLTELILEEGAMPRLQRVVIRQSYELRKVPDRFKSLGNLQLVTGDHGKHWESASSVL